VTTSSDFPPLEGRSTNGGDRFAELFAGVDEELVEHVAVGGLEYPAGPVAPLEESKKWL